MFKIDFHRIVGLTDQEKRKLLEARDLWIEVWNSKEFKAAVLLFTQPLFRGKWPFRKRYSCRSEFQHNEGRCRDRIYAHLTNSMRDDLNDDDHDPNVRATLEHLGPDVFGPRYAATLHQQILNLFWKRYDTATIAGNLAHEYCHQLDYEHGYFLTEDTPYTVPFAIGLLTEKLARQILEERQ